MSEPTKTGFREEVRVHLGKVYSWVRFKHRDENGLPV